MTGASLLPGATTLSLAELCAGAEPFTPAETAAVLGPLLEKVAGLHGAGRGADGAAAAAHGSLTLATVSVCVCGSAGDSVHLLPAPDAPERCARCIAPEDKLAGAGSQAGDVWSIGLIALQLLLGRQCAHAQRRGCCAGIVDRATGELPVLPRGISFECLDFLTDCLDPEPAQRPTAAALLRHPYIRAVASRGGADGDAAGGAAGAADADSDLDALLPVVHGLLICDAVRSRPPPCRPKGVPSLTTPLWDLRVAFEAPSHTWRCTRCAAALAHHGPCHARPAHDRPPLPAAAAAATCPAARRPPRRCPGNAEREGSRAASPKSGMPTKRRRCRSASLPLVAVAEDATSEAGGAPGGAKRARRDSFAACCGAVDEAPMPWSVVDVAVVFEQLAGVAGGASYLSSSPSPSPEQAPMAPPSLPLLPLVL